LAPTIGLTVAVVYTRYHYLTDAIGGLVVAVVVVAAVRFAPARPAADPPPAVPDPATALA
jgi:membrane-associated phospholipid phosphatase